MYDALTTCQLDDLIRANMDFDIRKCVEDITLWKAHQFRTVNQDKCKTDILKTLDSTSLLVTMDWAMKFLPRKYRESQSDWLGRRGLSWHLTVVLRRNQSGDFETLTFVHMTNTLQDSRSCFHYKPCCK